LKNRTPSKLLEGQTPYELVYGDKPNYDLIKVFGCLCFAQTGSGDKFASRSRRCIFIGYPFGKKSWKLYDLTNHKIFESRDVKFYEENLPFKDVILGSSGENHNETNLENMRYMDVEFGGFNGQGEFRTTGQRMPQQLTELLDPASPRSPIEQSPFPPLVSAAPAGPDASSGAPAIGPPSGPVTSEPSSDGGLDTADPSSSSSPPETRTNSPPVTRKSQRKHQLPGYLNQFICYSANIENPISVVTSNHEEFSCTSYPLHHYVTCVNFSLSHQHFLAAIMKVDEPKFYHKAVKDVNWREAVDEEIEALDKTGTWEIIDLPPSKHLIGCKWVYRVK